MARVKFIRDKEPNIIALNNNKQAIDGAIYIATDTGKMWMGLAAGTLLKIEGSSTVEIDTSLSDISVNPVQNKVIKAALDKKSDTTHTHNYAGSTTPGGAANTALALTGSFGTSTLPVYFLNGTPKACLYSLGATVPENAVFTDTTYTAGSGLSLSDTIFSIANKGVTNAHLADKAVTSSKLSDNIGTIEVSSIAPTDSHVKLWIKI